MHNRRILILSSLIFLIIIGTAITPLLGQGDTIITITAPGWVSHVFSDELFAPFVAQHPGVKVVSVDPGSDYYYPSAGEDLQKHLDGAQKYASDADVVYVDVNLASVEATRAGYLTNLAPFANSDPTFNSDDFFPKIWQSAQWDDGIWYIPASAYVGMWMYDVNAFDKAGLPYPNERWTFDDFAKAVRALTVHDKDGKVTVPGFQLYNPELFFYGLSGQSPLYDSSVSPSTPKFDNPDLAAFYEEWNALQKDTAATGSFDYDKTAFTFGSPWRIPQQSGDHKWATSLLPGGVTSLSIEGFGVSGGTVNPELAFALANFMSTNPEIIDAFGGDTPARRSLVNPDSKPAADIQAIEEALDKAVPISEFRFQDYLDAATSKTNDDGSPLDMKVAIQEAEANAKKGIDAASARRSTAVYVITPVPTPAMSENQIVLRFGLAMDTSSNQDVWRQVISDFLAANPSVGNVELDNDFFEQKDLDRLDCFYQPYNVVPSMKLENFLSFDPFMDADPNFDRNDFIGTVLDQMQRDNHIWGYPIVIQPSVMWYDSDLFSKAGLPSPEQGWTVDAFKDALQTLHGMMEKETDPVFVPGTYGNTYLLMLIAAYGGIPYDYRTTPPSINYTDPATVDAIRQVLDLARAGYIGYKKLNARDFIAGDLGQQPPLSDDVLSMSNWRLQNRANPDNHDASRIADFPHGSQYTPVAYTVGAAYIQNHAQSPDACYKWIAQIAKRPDLLGGMPARLTQINDPAITTAQGEDISALYQTLADTFQQPNTIAFPGQYGGDSGFNSYVEPLWLNRAFDSYVTENGDLDTDLATAETLTQAYRECASVIPEMEPEQLNTDDGATAYYRQFADCAIKVDPTMKEQFSYLYEDKPSAAQAGG